MKYVSVAVTVALAGVLVVAFNNCGSGGTITMERGLSSSSLQTPLPMPTPTTPYAIQPSSTNSMEDVKPMAAGVCPANYGVYDILNMTPAIDGSSWAHNLCVKPFGATSPSVIGDVQLVSGAVCPAGLEAAISLPYNSDSTVRRFAMAYTLCIKRASLPVVESFVTYFYLSSPGAACRTGDIANGTAMFCTVPNAAGQCLSPIVVNLCKSVQ